jgi:hypothetical protein
MVLFEKERKCEKGIEKEFVVCVFDSFKARQGVWAIQCHAAKPNQRSDNTKRLEGLRSGDG